MSSKTRVYPIRPLVTAGIFCSFLVFASLVAADWPHWRGPLGTGVSPDSGLPVTFSEEENLLWKTPIRGQGVSSPVIWGDQIFITSQLGRGTVRPGGHPSLSQGGGGVEASIADDATEPDEVTFLILSVNKNSGEVAWTYQLAAEGAFPEVHNKNNMATPSCVADAEAVYCWFSTGQVVALSHQGELRWQKSLASEYGPFEIAWGHASSPTLFENRLYLLSDHENTSYLLALDKANGEELWKVDRGSGLRSYSTPMIVPSDPPELLVNSSEGLDAYNPRTGEKLWHLEQSNRFPVPSPSFGDGIIYTSRGYRSGPYMAIRPGGKGDISGSHLKWHVDTGAPYVSSVVYYDGLVYMVNGMGIVTAADGETGETVWRERVGGVYSASPVAGDGKIYLTSEDGQVVVLEAGREPRVLGRSDLGEGVLASPAISDGRIFFRTSRHLVAVGGE